MYTLIIWHKPVKLPSLLFLIYFAVKRSNKAKILQKWLQSLWNGLEAANYSSVVFTVMSPTPQHCWEIWDVNPKCIFSHGKCRLLICNSWFSWNAHLSASSCQFTQMKACLQHILLAWAHFSFSFIQLHGFIAIGIFAVFKLCCARVKMQRHLLKKSAFNKHWETDLFFNNKYFKHDIHI